MKLSIISFYFTGLIFIAFFLFSSCASRRNVVYFQSADSLSYNSKQAELDYKVKIMPNDNLFIKVSSALNPSAVDIFNMIPGQTGTMSMNNLDILGYLVDSKGNINLPTVGEIHVAGLTKEEIIQLLQKKISEGYVTDPVVNVRILNYKITILGEVNKPGVYNVTDERISVPQALALAGDLTIYGQRRNVQLTRIENGEKKTYYFDLTSPEIFSSPNYYLVQNDVLYVSPNGTRVRSSTTNQNIPLTISIITAILTLASFFIRYK